MTRLQSTSPRNRSSSPTYVGLALCDRCHTAWASGAHGWVPVYTHSTPVPGTPGRLWVAQATPRAGTQRRRTRNGSTRTEPNDVQEPNDTKEGAQLPDFYYIFYYTFYYAFSTLFLHCFCNVSAMFLQFFSAIFSATYFYNLFPQFISTIYSTLIVHYF